ncbi:MAG: molybdenum cofactor biosynthesis protein C [Lentisphaerae bacterium RIFOXYB12_FULL_65_16]|nr:MAG: molybdenum cofactor biosynthesis protein C [Lentisphaerae bacterium RIFOXYA12_64_32]OGV92867.1 MAG: molybdenum cofactor biosynthesis protein C [Lentisphaerae bacterium RIFOXYB12_FULL_65_16]
MKNLSHVKKDGKATMVDVGAKAPQRRVAVATGRIELARATLERIRQNLMKKGDVLGVARLAGIQAAKSTPHLIPLCHPLLLDHIDVDLQPTSDGVTATARCACVGRTGVEMEALTAVSLALLTVYDMCKAVDKKMRITDIRLVKKVKQDV